MRARIWLATIAAGLTLATAAPAQQAMSFGPVGGPLIFQVANTDRSNIPISGPNVRSTSFKLSDIFAKVGIINNQQVVGSSNFPTPKQMPGKAYLSNFGIQRAPRAQ
jgi:hypothetical protein